MRIGVIAPVWTPVPPPGYGGVGQVVSLLAEELVVRGHEVTLFASGDSMTKASLVSVYPEAPTDRIDQPGPEAVHVGTAFRTAAARYADGEGFDLIHDHTPLLGMAFAATLDTPVVHTEHLAIDGDRAELVRRFADDVYLTAVSERQRQDHPDLPWRGVVHHAVDAAAFPFREAKDGYLLCLGRVCERKGQDLAIEAARRAGFPLVIAGKVYPGDAAFFEERVLPALDGETVTYAGEVSHQRKLELLAGASALLFPIRQAEPFGLVLIEAMACGTPVIASSLGAVPEIVADGETGFVVDGPEAMADATTGLPALSARRCRDEVERRFDLRAMVDGYEAVYRDILAGL